MIGLIFTFGGDVLDVRIINHQILFRTSGSPYAETDGLKLDKVGVIKEFPELKDNEDWKKIAIQKFKDKIKTMSDEKAIRDYVIEDLNKHGYKLIAEQKAGFRMKRYV